MCQKLLPAVDVTSKNGERDNKSTNFCHSMFSIVYKVASFIIFKLCFFLIYQFIYYFVFFF